MFLKRIIPLVVILVVLLGAGYAAAGTYIYNIISRIPNHCDQNSSRDNTPQEFDIGEKFADTIDPSPFFNTETPYETVTFSSRNQPDITISAWYFAAQTELNSPTVIVVHGLGGCRRETKVLYAATMLTRAGFNVLTPDLNDHGESAVVDGKFSAGILEHLDVLGGYDWLVEQGVAPQNIGLMGFSLGGGTAAIAFAQEPNISALWTDSAFSALEKTVAYELRDQYGLPSFLAGSAIQMGQIVDGIDVSRYSPVDAFGEARNGRPVFLTHSTADARLSVDFAYDLTAAVQATDPTFEAWIVDEVGHTDIIFVYTEAYQTRLVEFFSQHLGTSAPLS